MKKKICAITTVEGTLRTFVIPTMKILKDKGYDITLVCSMTEEFIKQYSNEFKCVNMPMKRGVSLRELIIMPFKFRRFFLKERFDLVQYATPNASFFASIGAKWAKVPKRVYCQWGIRYVSFSGLQRFLFKAIEKRTCKNSTHIRPASWKNLEFAVEEGLYNREKAAAIGDGGTVGIDLEQFNFSKKEQYKLEIQEKYPQFRNNIVYAFVGRLNKDKGIVELLEAFLKLNKQHHNTSLMLIGNMEGSLSAHLETVKQNQNIIFTGYTKDVPKFLAGADVLVHPSYREGFSMVIQQAMAMEIPVVTTDIPGPSEVIEPNVSGILAKPRDVETLYECMKWMAEHPKEREQMGKAGRIRCEEKFNRERMLKLTLEDREQILKE